MKPPPFSYFNKMPAENQLKAVDRSVGPLPESRNIISISNGTIQGLNSWRPDNDVRSDLNDLEMTWINYSPEINND